MDETKSIQELMEIAKIPLKEDKHSKLTPVHRFIVVDELEKGDVRIPAALIYDRYLKWAALANVAQVGLVTFFKEFKLYFSNKVTTNKGIFYVMGSKGFDLSPEYLEHVNQTHLANKRISHGKKKKRTPRKEDEK